MSKSPVPTASPLDRDTPQARVGAYRSVWQGRKRGAEISGKRFG